MILLYVLLPLAVVIVILAIVVAMQPADFRIARSITINAAPDVVHGLVNDLHEWEHWSPWAKKDPGMKKTYGGPSSGAGATYAWEGNKDVGEGRMAITESTPGRLVRMKLEFLKPFQATNAVEFTFRAEGGPTLVTWSMTGTNNYMGKAFALLMNMDKMVGGDFEKGLAAMKARAEGK
jgi:hypothetical protein